MERDVNLAERAHISISLATVRLVLIGTLVWLLPFNDRFLVQLGEHSPHLAGLLGNTFLGPIDVILALLMATTIPLLAARSRPRPLGIGLIGASAFVGIAATSLLFNPSLEGFMLVFRFTGVAATIYAIRAMSRPDVTIAVVWSFALGALIQGSIAIGQTLIFDSGNIAAATLLASGRQWTAGVGLFLGPYTMAAFLVLAIAVVLSMGTSGAIPVTMWLSVGVSSAAIATTFGRAGVLSVLLLSAVYFTAWLFRRKSTLVWSSVVAAGPMFLIGLLLRSAWTVRVAASANLDSSGRGGLISRAFDVIRVNPLFGVGPAQYGPTLARIGLTDVDWQVVHNLPLLVAAEFGIVTGVLFVAWLVLLGIAAFATSIPAGALFLVVIPYFLFDNLHYVFGTGIAMVGLWVAMLDFHRYQPTTVNTKISQPGSGLKGENSARIDQ